MGMSVWMPSTLYKITAIYKSKFVLVIDKLIIINNAFTIQQNVPLVCQKLNKHNHLAATYKYKHVLAGKASNRLANEFVYQ